MNKAKKIALLEYKNKILEDIKYCEKGINDLRNNFNNNKYFQDLDSSDSDDGLCEIIDTGPGVQKLLKQQSMLKTCFNATQELTGLNILQSEVNVLVQDPQFNNKTPITEPGTWREVTAECRIDLVPFTITFFTHKAIRKFAPTLFLGLDISLVKPSHELELNNSVLQTVKKPSDGVEVIRSYAKEHRSRRTTIACLADKYASSLFMETHPEGGIILKCANLLEIWWRLENKWSPLAPFQHRMKFDLEYMDESYVKIITQAHKELLDPSIQTDERSLLLSKIISTCLEAKGPIDSESDLESVGIKSKQTENQSDMEASDRDRAVMAPPKNLPKKTKKIVVNEKTATLKRSTEDSHNVNNAKKTKLATGGAVKNNMKNKENNADLIKNKTRSSDDHDHEINNDNIKKRLDDKTDVNNLEIMGKPKFKTSKTTENENVPKIVNNTNDSEKKSKNNENSGRKRNNENDSQGENSKSNTEKQSIAKKVKSSDTNIENNIRTVETNKPSKHITNNKISDKVIKDGREKCINSDTTEQVSKSNKNKNSTGFVKQIHKDEKNDKNTNKDNKQINKSNKKSKIVNNDNSDNIPKKHKHTSEVEMHPHEGNEKLNDGNSNPNIVNSETKNAIKLQKNNIKDTVSQKKGVEKLIHNKDGDPVRKIDKKTKISIASDKKFDIILKKTNENKNSGHNNKNKDQVEQRQNTHTSNKKSNEEQNSKKANIESVEVTEKNVKIKDKIANIHNTGENMLQNQKLNRNKPEVLSKIVSNKLSKITNNKTAKNIHKSPSRKNPLKLQNMVKVDKVRPFVGSKIVTSNKNIENEGKFSKIPQIKNVVNNENNFKKNMLRISPRIQSSKFRTSIQDNTKNIVKNTNIPRLMKKPMPKVSK